MDTVLQDIKIGWRLLARRPGFAAIAVVTLALGIGGNTAVFTVVNTVLLRPLPYPDSEGLLRVSEQRPFGLLAQFHLMPRLVERSFRPAAGAMQHFNQHDPDRSRPAAAAGSAGCGRRDRRR